MPRAARSKLDLHRVLNTYGVVLLAPGSIEQFHHHSCEVIVGDVLACLHRHRLATDVATNKHLLTIRSKREQAFFKKVVTQGAKRGGGAERGRKG